MTSPRPVRAYLDTSVFGGVADDEFSRASERVFEEIRLGRIALLLGQTTVDELRGAPEVVQRVLESVDPSTIVACPTTDEVRDLRDEYVKASVLSSKWLDDATHVAAATVYRAHVLISWNFKHLVHWERERGFNLVNYRLGYQQISIRSPLEVGHEGEDL